MNKKIPKLMNDAAKKKAEEEIKQHAKTIDYSTSEFTLEVIDNKFRKGDFYIPEYQRNDIWENERKSKFIESLLIGLPIPFLFFWQNDDGRLEVVDGVQRLTTIRQFLNNELILKGLKKLSSLNRFQFSDLVESRQRKFSDISIRSIMLTERADALTRFDLFERINTTSKNLTQAELRKGLLKGGFLDMVESLTKNKRFQKMVPMSDRLIASGDREETISRFFAYGDGLDDYKNSIKDFIFSYTDKMNKAFKNDSTLKASYEERFIVVMDFFYEKYPNGFKASKNAVSKTKFESLAIGAYLAFKEDKRLKGIITTEHIDNFCKTSLFIDAIKTDASNTTKKLKHRLNITKEEFLSKIK